MAKETTGRDEGQEISRQPAQDQQAPEAGKQPAEAEGGERTREHPVFRAQADIYETDDGLMLVADLPGVSPDGLDITLDRRVLSIYGRVSDDAPSGYSPIYREYEIGDFERRFTLSGDFDADRIEAELRDGVLRLRIPKAPEPEAKKIKVGTG